MKKVLHTAGLCSLALFFLLATSSVMAQRTASVSGPWSSTATWGGLSVPTSTDAVTINNNIAVTIDVAAQCASLTIAQGTLPSSVQITGTNSLTMTGDLIINRATADGIVRTVDVGSGTLSCANVSMTNPANDTRVCKILISTGTFSASGDIVMSGSALRNMISFSGSGTLNLKGSISGGDIIPSTGTVNYNGTSPQTVLMNATYEYYNLHLNNAATATLGAAVTATRVLGNIRVQSGIFSNGGFGITGTAAQTFEVADGATFLIEGATTAFPTTYTASLGATSTVEYKGSGDQTVADIATPGYGNLILSNGGIKTVAVGDGLDVRGNITLNSGISFNTRTYVHNIGGNWIDNGAAVTGNSTINFNGSSAQNVAGSVSNQAFYKVIVNNGAGVSLSSDFTVLNSTLTINNPGKLIIPAGKQVTVTGVITNNAGTSGLVLGSDAGGSASLMHTTAGIQGTVQRYVSAANSTTDGWHLISSPVSGAVSGLFTGLYLQSFSEVTNTYSDIYTVNTPLDVMKGYALFTTNAFVADYAGTINSGAMGATNNLTRTGAGANVGWNLVGNPFPSAIDWDAATGWTKTRVNNSVYIHVSASSWATYVGGVGTNGGSRYIAPGQGFFVQVSSATTGTLRMNNSVRLHNSVSFYKDQEVIPNLVRLQVTGNNYSDEAVIRFLPEATTEFDSLYDAHKLYGDEPMAAQLYTLGSTPLSINAVPETKSVPVGIHAGVNGTYTISATEINDFSNLTLEDTKTGIFTDIIKNSYSFSFTQGESEQRFVLHFGALSIDENENTLANVYSYLKTVYVSLGEHVSADIYIYNMSGQLVATRNSSQGMTEINLAKTGNYIVKVVSNENILVRKVFIK